MVDTYCVSLKTLVEEYNLEIVFAATDYDRIRLTVEDVSRPGLQIAGYMDHFEPMRLQIIGNVESSYLQKLSESERALTFDRLFSYKFPALLIARNIEVDPQCLAMAKKHNVTLLRTPEATSTIISNIITYLRDALAPRITRHGVLVEVYGEGILLVGDSGIGKSEAAGELLKRGHRLVADDAVEIRRISNELVGCAPEVIRHYIELRGIGVIDVRQLFGMRAIKDDAQITLVVTLEPWDDSKFYDRLGIDIQYTEIMDVKVPAVTIPVRPGRNLASIVEVAAMNNRHRRYGYNAAEELVRRVDERARGNL